MNTKSFGMACRHTLIGLTSFIGPSDRCVLTGITSVLTIEKLLLSGAQSICMLGALTLLVR